MSTVDTLINAVAAVVVNDVYKPIVKDRNDKHYLKVAMIVSAGATVLGATSTIFFNNKLRQYKMWHWPIIPRIRNTQSISIHN